MKTSIPVALFPPSLKDSCPRKGCGLTMSTTRIEDFELVHCSCGYSFKEQTGAMKAEYASRLHASTAQGQRVAQ